MSKISELLKLQLKEDMVSTPPKKGEVKVDSDTIIEYVINDNNEIVFNLKSDKSGKSAKLKLPTDY